MKILMRSLAIGPLGAMYPDQVYDLEDALATALVENGYAEAVAETPVKPNAGKTAKRETATAGKREKAVKE